MNISFIKKTGEQRLILIFAGWGMDAGVFAGTTFPDSYDFAVAWDYRSEDCDRGPLAAYREVVVVAWSLGVLAAERILPALSLPVTLAVAVNGTLTPVDDERGIPEAVFNGTLASLSDATLLKFRRRMCGTSPRFNEFMRVAPGRPLDDLRDELLLMRDRARLPLVRRVKWDMAFIGDADMIFPAANQQKAWEHTRTQLMAGEPHLPDFNRIMARCVVDKQMVADRFGRNRPGYDSGAGVQARVADRLVELWRLTAMRDYYDNAVEIGAGTGILTRRYADSVSIGHLELWDIAPVAVRGIERRFDCVTADAEIHISALADKSVDLLLSSSTLQWFNSPLAFLRNVARVMRRGGHVVVSFFGCGTLENMRRATGLSLNYVAAGDAVASVADCFDVMSVMEDSLTEEFDTVADALRHLRSIGVNSVGRAPLPVDDMRALLADERLRTLEYRPVYLVLQRK